MFSSFMYPGLQLLKIGSYVVLLEPGIACEDALSAYQANLHYHWLHTWLNIGRPGWFQWWLIILGLCSGKVCECLCFAKVVCELERRCLGPARLARDTQWRQTVP